MGTAAHPGTQEAAMTIDATTPRSRRMLLSAAAGAVGALVAQAVVPRSAVEAANGDPLVLGSATNAATATTKLTNTAAGPVLHVQTNESQGVSGFAMYGDATTGFGVGGNATSGRGVVGTSFSGVGVEGHSPTGIGVYAKSENDIGTGLWVDGKVHFSRSGRTWIRAGQASLKIAAQGTAGNSRVFAVLASNRPGRYVRAVVPTTNAFTVYLNASALSDSVVTWFILD
jgi:hypothetical protein